ncbi:GNAT family N-acetyltransferase [Propionibacteriaceae bacterium Y1685]
MTSCAGSLPTRPLPRSAYARGAPGGAVRLLRVGSAVELGRLTVVPYRQGMGVGSFLLREAETVFPEIREMQIFTGEHSTANLRLYERSGYVETGRTPVGDYSIVHLTKALTSSGPKA